MKHFQTFAPDGAHRQGISAGQGAFVLSKWRLLKAVEEIREELGLKGTSIAVLRAMLSFVRSDDIGDERDADHICFASNATLAERSHVSIQTVERHIAKLVDLGLLTRRSSGNGKRWARRNRQGDVVLATGLSLMPLVHRHAEFLKLAERLHKQREGLKLLRDRCAIALARLAELAVAPAVLDGLRQRARNLFRRKPDEAGLDALLVDITHEIEHHESPTPDNLKGTDPENEGHKEPSLIQLVERKDPFLINVDPEDMERAFPRLCSELRFARSQNECSRRMDELAAQLCLKDVWFTVTDLGPALRFMILGYLLERAETIRTPRAYANRLVGDLSAGTLSWKSLLVRPSHQKGRGVI